MATLRRLLTLSLLGLAAGQQMSGLSMTPNPFTESAKLQSLVFNFTPGAAIVAGQVFQLFQLSGAIFASAPYTGADTVAVGGCTFTLDKATSINSNLRFTVPAGCTIAAGSATTMTLSSAFLGTNPVGANEGVIVNCFTSGTGTLNALATTPASYVTTTGTVVPPASSPSPAAAATCAPYPPTFTNGAVSACTSNRVGGSCTVTCPTGYTPNGSPSISCVATGTNTAAWQTTGSCVAAVGQITNLAVLPSTYVGGEKLNALGIQYRPTVPIVSGDRLTFTADYPIYSGNYANAQPFVVGSCRYTLVPSASDTMHLAFTLSDAVAGVPCNVPTTSNTVFPLSAAYLGENPPPCTTVNISAVSTNSQGVITNQMGQTSYDTLCEDGGSSGCWYLFFLFFLIPCCLIPCCLLFFLRRQRNKPFKGCKPPCCPQQPQWPYAGGMYAAPATSAYVPPTMDCGLRPAYKSAYSPFASYTSPVSNPYSSNPYLSAYPNPYLPAPTYTSTSFSAPLCSAPAPTYTTSSMYMSSPYYY